MHVEFIDVKYNKEVKLTAEAIKKLKKFSKVALFAGVQFVDKLPEIAKQLEKEGIGVILTRADRAGRIGQVLGCDVYHENLGLEEDIDCVLFIGDGKFHINALLFAGVKNVIQFDPISKKLKVYAEKDIKKVKDKQKANLKKFLMADVIGVIVSTKYGQEHPQYVEMLKAKYPSKKFYVFVCDAIDFSEFENFNFVKAWVNTACPRIGLEDALNAGKAVVNVCDVL